MGRFLNGWIYDIRLEYLWVANVNIESILVMDPQFQNPIIPPLKSLMYECKRVYMISVHSSEMVDLGIGVNSTIRYAPRGVAGRYRSA
jgi:hypothetical protein